MHKYFFTVIFSFIIIAASSQKIFIKGEETARKLNWNDFTGKPEKESPFFAYTFWNLSYKAEDIRFKGDTVNWKVQVIYEFTKDSWKKKDHISDTLLKHEQTHFDIGLLCAIELQAKLNTTVFFKSNFSSAANKMVMDYVEKVRRLNHQYDEESKHGGVRPGQWKWDDFVKSELQKVK